MVLSEHTVCTGEHPFPKTVEERESELKGEEARPTNAGCKKMQKKADEGDERDEEAHRIICLTVSNLLQALICYPKTAKGAGMNCNESTIPTIHNASFHYLDVYLVLT